MKYQLIKNYKNHNTWRKSFNQLAHDTFNIDFEKWYQRGEWTNDFCCYSLLDGDSVIANVSTSRFDVVIEGKPFKAIQIGTVMTHEKYRNKGLSKFLMEHVIEVNRKDVDLIYLFANASVFYYYQQFGLTPVKEYLYAPVNIDTLLTSKTPGTKNDLRNMNFENEEDLLLLRHVTKNRTPISRKFGVLCGESIMTWYAINIFPKDYYYSNTHRSIIVCQKDGDVMRIYDIVSEGVQSYNVMIQDMKNYFDTQRELNNVDGQSIHKVQFHFTPDLLVDDPVIESEKTEDLMFVLTEYVQIPSDYLYPIINHT